MLFAAYVLRFDSWTLRSFFLRRGRCPSCGSQIAGLSIFLTYTYRQGRRWLPRLLAGVFVGTAVGALWYGLSMDLKECPHFFPVSALLLASRGLDGVLSLASLADSRCREERASGHEMEDRTAAPSVSAGLLGIVAIASC